MEIKCFVTHSSSNSYLVVNGSSAIVVDAGGRADDILAYTAGKAIIIDALLLTHAHYDHIKDVNAYFDKGIRVYLHRDEAGWMCDSELNLAGIFGTDFEADKDADVLLAGGEILNLAGMDVEVYHTPGHTPGSVCYRIADKIFSGDTLFRESIGRYDFPGGDGVQIRRSIAEKLLTQSDNTVIYPGHGPESTIAYERVNNPFLK